MLQKIFSSGLFLLLLGTPAFSGTSSETATPRMIQLEVKVLEIRKTETILMANPKTMGPEGKSLSVVMGSRIPVQYPNGESRYLDEKMEIDVVPRIITDQGIELTVKVFVQKVDPKTTSIRQVTLNKVAVVGNLETMVMELMEKKEDRSRIVLQLSPMVAPDPPAPPQDA